MHNRYLPVVSLLLALGCVLPPAMAGDEVSEGTVAVALQAADEDGNRAKMREDSLGQQGGLALELFHYSSSDDRATIELDARFSSGRNGWLDLEVTSDHWHGGVNATMVTSWSNRSFANDFLPSGAAVASLYPGTTSLDSLFGVSSPKNETLFGEAWVTRRWAGPNRLTLRAGTRQRDGERVPNYGGFSFSDVGTPAFFTSGLETFDSSATWFELEGLFELGSVDLRVAAGRTEIETDRRDRLPAYGQTALLDLNEWRDRSRVDTDWLRLDARWSGDRLGFYGSFATFSTTNDPSGFDRRVDASGNAVADGLTLGGGAIDLDAAAGAIGATWKACRHATVTLAFDSRSSDGEGDLDLFQRDAAIVPAASEVEEERVGATLQLKLAGGPYWARLRARATSVDRDRRELRGELLRSTERDTERVDARVDAAVAFAESWELRAWARLEEVDTDVALIDLWSGYAAGDWERTTTSGSVALGYRRDGVRAALSMSVADSDLDSGVPWYDPIFDPSTDLVPVSADVSERRLAGSLVWPFERGSLWVEAGWLEAEYDVPTTADLTGFALTSETLTGTVAAIGGDRGLWKGGNLSARIEWVEDSDDLEARIVRGHVEVDHDLGDALGLFGRWAYWDFTNDLAPSDDYTVSVLVAGVRARF